MVSFILLTAFERLLPWRSLAGVRNAVGADGMSLRWVILGGFCLVLAALPPLLLNQRLPLLGEALGIFIDGYYLSLVPNIFDSNI